MERKRLRSAFSYRRICRLALITVLALISVIQLSLSSQPGCAGLGGEELAESIPPPDTIRLEEGPESNETSEHDYHNDPWTYLIFSLVMTFGLMSVLAGLFALKFSDKKAKKIAIPMILVGLVIWGFWIYFNFIDHAGYPDDTLFGIIHWVAAPLLKPLMAVIGVLLGGGLSLFIFLTAVVRS